MSQHANQERLDYRESEQVAFQRFGVDSVMVQDGLLEISERATPSEWANYFLKHHDKHDLIFIASAIDAMLYELIRTEDKSDLDTVRQALLIAQHEPWACACIECHTEDYGDYRGEAFVVHFLHDTLDLSLVRANRESITKKPQEGS